MASVCCPSEQAPSVEALPVCRHCHRPRPLRRKQLCWTCYQVPGVKEAYLSLEARGRRFESEDLPPEILPPEPARPTAYRPGSPPKRGVLRWRARRRLQLHHAFDSRIMPAPRAVQRARNLFARTFQLVTGGEE